MQGQGQGDVDVGHLDEPRGAVLETGAWLGLVSGLSLVLVLAVSSIVGSRGTTIGIVFAWQIVVTPLLLQIKALGPLREGPLGAATNRLRPSALISGPTHELTTLQPSVERGSP